MDPKIVFMLFLIEIAALVFTTLHLLAPEISLYNAYNQEPTDCSRTLTSQRLYCFTDVNHCVYNEHLRLQPLHVLHMVFICFTVFSYICILIILLFHCESHKIPGGKYCGCTFYRFFQMIIILSLCLNSLLLGITYWQDGIQIHQCSQVSRLVRIENMVTYIIVNILEVVYNTIDILTDKAKINQELNEMRDQINGAGVNQFDENDSTVRIERGDHGAALSYRTFDDRHT